MRNQPEPQKPEWFELLDGDAPSAQVTKVNKKLPVVAALVTGVILASGALFAGASQDKSTGESSVVAINQVDNTTGANSNTVSESAPGAVVATVNSNSQQPSIQNPTSGGVKPPGRGGDDDDDHDDDHDDDNHDDHEGEGHKRGGDRDRDEH